MHLLTINVPRSLFELLSGFSDSGTVGALSSVALGDLGSIAFAVPGSIAFEAVGSEAFGTCTALCCLPPVHLVYHFSALVCRHERFA